MRKFGSEKRLAASGRASDQIVSPPRLSPLIEFAVVILDIKSLRRISTDFTNVLGAVVVEKLLMTQQWYDVWSRRFRAPRRAHAIPVPPRVRADAKVEKELKVRIAASQFVLRDQ